MLMSNPNPNPYILLTLTLLLTTRPLHHTCRLHPPGPNITYNAFIEPSAINIAL